MNNLIQPSIYVLGFGLIILLQQPAQGGKWELNLFNCVTKRIKGPALKAPFSRRQFSSDTLEKKYNWNKGSISQKKEENGKKESLDEQPEGRKLLFDPKRSLYYYETKDKNLNLRPPKLIYEDETMVIYSKEVPDKS